MRSPRIAAQAGFSLVELMVALLIGVILTSGVISVFITSRASYSMNTGLGQVQEAGRFALGTMQPIVVMAGNSGCSHPPDPTFPLNSWINSADPVYNMRHAVYGFEYTGTGIGAPHAATATAPIATNPSDWSPALSTSPLVQAKLIGTGTPVLKYSDVLMVHEMLTNPAAVNVDDKIPGGTFTYATTNAPAISAGMMMIASDCEKNFFAFQASSATVNTVSHGASGNPGNNVPGSYSLDFSKAGGSVGPAQTYVFFVGSGIGGESSLYEASLETSGINAGKLGTPKEMVPGVENMQVLYGVDTGTNGSIVNTVMDNIPDSYWTAAEVDAGDTANTCTPGSCWDRVVSVRVALLVHSDSNTTDKAPAAATTFHMLGTDAADSFNYTTNVDRRLRRYFVQTFSFRNLLP